MTPRVHPAPVLTIKQPPDGALIAGHLLGLDGQMSKVQRGGGGWGGHRRKGLTYWRWTGMGMREGMRNTREGERN